MHFIFAKRCSVLRDTSAVVHEIGYYFLVVLSNWKK